MLTGLSNSFGITSLSSAGSYTTSVAGTLSNSNYTLANPIDGTWLVTTSPPLRPNFEPQSPSSVTFAGGVPITSCAYREWSDDLDRLDERRDLAGSGTSCRRPGNARHSSYSPFLWRAEGVTLLRRWPRNNNTGGSTDRGWGLAMITDSLVPQGAGSGGETSLYQKPLFPGAVSPLPEVAARELFGLRRDLYVRTRQLTLDARAQPVFASDSDERFDGRAHGRATPPYNTDR